MRLGRYRDNPIEQELQVGRMSMEYCRVISLNPKFLSNTVGPAATWQQSLLLCVYFCSVSSPPSAQKSYILEDHFSGERTCPVWQFCRRKCGAKYCNKYIQKNLLLSFLSKRMIRGNPKPSLQTETVNGIISTPAATATSSASAYFL